MHHAQWAPDTVSRAVSLSAKSRDGELSALKYSIRPVLNQLPLSNPCLQWHTEEQYRFVGAERTRSVSRVLRNPYP
ncbi:hypothetical protein C8Q80DRAFT_458718 [Daedaleopsis nitida]|nr:hypothetical protein C8Q80DRAFT_458718 [Daedaleopsis nitida]